MNLLNNYGITERFLNEANMYKDLKLARIVAQYRGLYKIITNDGEFLGEISGKLRYTTDELAKYPAVGDFVMVAYDNNDDRVIIHHILSRKSAFMRSAVGLSGQAQIIASNIDIVFICMSLNNNYNLNRLERYLSIAWDSGATPVILLTKADLCENLHNLISEVSNISPFCDIIPISMFDSDIADKLKNYLQQGMTAAFIGSSGVGKSTLINKILGNDIITTNEIDKADKGRHTTTGKEMFCCKFGGVVIDTPGMREIAVESADLASTFEDIEVIAKKCKYNNCTHTSEPGCAVLQAINDGVVDKRRLDNYLKLQKEAGYDGLNSKEIEVKKFERMFKDVGGIKNARKIMQESKKRKR